MQKPILGHTQKGEENMSKLERELIMTESLGVGFCIGTGVITILFLNILIGLICLGVALFLGVVSLKPVVDNGLDKEVKKHAIKMKQKVKKT